MFLVVDNEQSDQVELVGEWLSSHRKGGYYGLDDLHDDNTGGGKSVSYRPDLPKAGVYEVYLRWTTNENRATNARVEVVHSGGSDATTVNQQINGGSWQSLGEYDFAAGTAGTVTVSNKDANGNWIGSTQGYGATARGLYNEAYAWPDTAAFTTPYGSQAYMLNGPNNGMTTAENATGLVVTAGEEVKVFFNAAIPSGVDSSKYTVQLVAFDDNEGNSTRNDVRGGIVGTVLASSSGAVTTHDFSKAVTFSYTPTETDPTGQELGLRLLKSGAVLYDNIRGIAGHDFAPTPESGVTVPSGKVKLSWANRPANVGSDVWVDVWLGTDPEALVKVKSARKNLAATTVTAPIADVYYWRVDTYPEGDATGAPVAGDLFFFVVDDSDGDGLPDTYERAHADSATALNPDDDLENGGAGDGLTNTKEYFYGTDPNKSDTDGDGLEDGAEINATAGVRPATNPLLTDTDGDGLGDFVETHTGNWTDASQTGTDPTDPDRDKDGIKDGAETNTGVLVDRFDTGTDPFKPDTDGDGAGDFYEVNAAFTDPTSGTDTPLVPYPLPDPVPTDLGDANKPVKIYIMAGQSNTVGIGYVGGTEPGSLDSMTQRENKFPNFIDESRDYTRRNDVIYRGVVTANGNNGPLTAGQGADSSRIGPELGFGHVMGWYHDEPVLIIKASQGNRSLGWDYLPPGSPSWEVDDRTYAGYGQYPSNWLTDSEGPRPGGWYAGKEYDNGIRDESELGMIAWADGTAYAKNHSVRHNGAAYRCTSAHTGDASTEPGVGANWQANWSRISITNAADLLDFKNGTLKNLPTDGNDLNGRSFEIAGFCWWQGHKDHTSSIYAPRYEQHLVRLIKALRADFKAPKAPVVVASIGFGGGEISTKPDLYQEVHSAQMAVGDPDQYPEFAGTVKSVNILPYWRELDESPGGQDFHYNNNAETYTLVGDTMARAMLEMKDDTKSSRKNR